MVLFPLCFVHLDMPTGIGGHLAIDSFGLAALKSNYSNLTSIWIVSLPRAFFWPLIARLHPIPLVDWMKYAAGRFNRARLVDWLWLRL
jgi:hypothetical protein